MSKALCCVWDFTIPESKIEFNELKKLIDSNCKKFAFQLEQGEETGYKHYQGRISLKTKKRLTSLKKIFGDFVHWSPTSNSNRDNNFYVTKKETRISGPWTDKDQYIPRQIREIKSLFPWQEHVISLSKKWDTRSIHIIVDKTGNIGKSILCTYMGVHNLGNVIPYCNDFKDIMRMVMDMPVSKAYLIDMPKAINKEKLYQLFSAIETIKNGYAYDDRYNFRFKYFDCPNIFVFTNKDPDISLLSRDRWKFWKVEEKKLVDYKIEDEFLMEKYDSETHSSNLVPQK